MMELEDAFEHLCETYFAEEREEIEQLPRLFEDCRLFIDVGPSLGQMIESVETARLPLRRAP